jgi:hypothetical protein
VERDQCEKVHRTREKRGRVHSRKETASPHKTARVQRTNSLTRRCPGISTTSSLPSAAAASPTMSTSPTTLPSASRSCIGHFLVVCVCVCVYASVCVCVRSCVVRCENVSGLFFGCHCSCPVFTHSHSGEQPEFTADQEATRCSCCHARLVSEARTDDAGTHWSCCHHGSCHDDIHLDPRHALHPAGDSPTFRHCSVDHQRRDDVIDCRSDPAGVWQCFCAPC